MTIYDDLSPRANFLLVHSNVPNTLHKHSASASIVIRPARLEQNPYGG